VVRPVTQPHLANELDEIERTEKLQRTGENTDAPAVQRLAEAVKRPRRGHRYRALAHGFKILKSPIAASFKAAAEHYDPTDAPPMRSEGVD
jgi:hypothetical protein